VECPSKPDAVCEIVRFTQRKPDILPIGGPEVRIANKIRQKLVA
jgi:hypothetical protein